MIDVFLRTMFAPELGRERFPKLRIRQGMYFAVRARWEEQADAKLWLVPSKGTIAAKRYAEEHASTDIYVVADDDCLPIGRDFIEGGLAAMILFQQYGALGAVSISDGYHAILGGHFSNANPIQVEAAGGIVFVRKGVLTVFDDCAPDQVDDVIAQEFKRKGWKVGVMPHVKFNHLGAGFSVTSRSADNWKA